MITPKPFSRLRPTTRQRLGARVGEEAGRARDWKHTRDVAGRMNVWIYGWSAVGHITHSLQALRHNLRTEESLQILLRLVHFLAMTRPHSNLTAPPLV